MKKVLWMVAVLGMAASFALGEDMVDNPAYKQWSAFKVGTMVKQASTTVMTVADKEMTTKTTITTTLKELTPEKAVIEMVIEMDMNGQKTAMPAQSTTIPAKVAKDAATQPAAPPGVKVTEKGKGDEEIEVGGKKYKCHWVEMEMTSDQFSTTSKTWTCADVPGGTVKMVSETTKPMKSKTTMEMVEFKPGT